MATTRVRFQFICQFGAVTFERLHDIPRSLVETASENGDPSDEYRQSWSTATRLVMDEREADCLRHSSPVCACGLPAITTSQLPMPFLDEAEPRVVVTVEPLCGQEKCRTRVRQETLRMMSGPRGPDGSPQYTDPLVVETVMSCKVCAKAEGVKKCGRCRAVAYCGREHQKQDWPIHKPGCIPWAE
ncbi:hypothetical protein EDB80DRAFT_736498 [Ilyonectria destructans]|nr:hypothetical protein EDB80DRAFT_736498 [Ilyonectria destructans]